MKTELMMCVAISITYSKCFFSLSYPACNLRTPQYVVTCGLSGSTVFSTLSHKRHDFPEKVLNIKKLFLFPVECLSETVLILRRILRNIIISVHASSCKVPAILV